MILITIRLPSDAITISYSLLVLRYFSSPKYISNQATRMADKYFLLLLELDTPPPHPRPLRQLTQR
jgi:hypothetical protein